MGFRSRRAPNPLDQLGYALGAAAANINNAQMRAINARKAEQIPVGPVERTTRSRKGYMARKGRRLLASLISAAPEDLDHIARELFACRDAVLSRFEVTSEVKYAGNRK